MRLVGGGGGGGVLSASLWHFIGLGPITQNKAHRGEREGDIYANILHNVQAICKANSISFFGLSQSPPSSPPQSQVMCKRKVKCKADDGQTDRLTDRLTSQVS